MSPRPEDRTEGSTGAPDLRDAAAPDRPGDPLTGPLAVDVAGVRFQNPVWTASGTCGYGERFERAFDVARLGAVVTKTLFVHPRDGNPPPRIAEVAGGMLNSIGLANVGWQAFLRDKVPWLRANLGAARLVVNVAGNSTEEYADAAALVESSRDGTGAAMLEINISCPNVNEGGTNIGCDLRLTRDVVRAVRAATSLPLLVKLSPNNADLVPFARLAQDEGADGVTVINTLFGMTVDLATRRPFLGHGSGGLSGPVLLPVGVYWTYKICQAVRLPVIGVGGITRAEDALQYLMAGARAVQVGTASFGNPFASLEVLEGIERFLDERRLALEEVIGAAHERRPQNLAVEAAR